MRKTLLKAIPLLLAVFMIAGLCVSCSGKPNLQKMTEAERADYLVEVLDEMDADSFAVDMEGRFSGSINEIDVTCKYTVAVACTNARADAPFTHEAMDMVVEMNGKGIDETQEFALVSGYRDGKMYEMEEDEDGKNALVSPISAEDYAKHKTRMEEITGGDEVAALLKLAGTKTSQKNEDDTWSAKLSGYSNENIEKITAELFEAAMDLFADDYEVKDYVLEITIDQDHLPTSMKLSAVFEGDEDDEDKPEMTMLCTFKDYDQTTLPEVDLSSYTEVEDLASLLEVQKTLSVLRSADELSFTSKNRSDTKYAGTTQTTKETDEVTVKVVKDKYLFDIDATITSDGEKTEATIKYEKGKMTISGKDIQTQSQSMDESAARSYIGDLLDPAKLSSASVSKISHTEGTYTHEFTIADPDYSEFEEAFESLNAKNFQATASVWVKYENGVLGEYKYVYRMTAQVEGKKLEVEVIAVVNINQPEATETSPESESAAAI